MSLVGKIEEMGLGEILQIVSLSRRTGVLSLESRGRKARITFQNGQVTSASSTALQQNLGEMLVRKRIIDETTLKRALIIQAGQGYRQLLGSVMVEHFSVSAEAIETVVGEQIENVVYALLAWTQGTFEFVMQEVAETGVARTGPVQYVLKQGLNPQYLAMEGARMIDEMRHRGETYEEPEVAAAEPAPSGFPLATPKVYAPPEPATPPLGRETVESAEVTAWLVMAIGGAALVYGMVGLGNYYSRDWYTALSEGALVPVSKLSIFFRLGFLPWTITVASLYLLWAAHQFWKLRKNSRKRLMKGIWFAIAVVVVHEAVELTKWITLSSSTPTVSFYLVGISDSLFWALALSAPFAGLLWYLNSGRVSREFSQTR